MYYLGSSNTTTTTTTITHLLQILNIDTIPINTTKTKPRTRTRARNIVLNLSLLLIIVLLNIIVDLHTTTTTSKHVVVVQAYNLDYQKALPKHGPKGSYFGYSLAQHAVFEQQNPNSTFKSFVLVGAPKDNSLFGAVRPGAIYRCDLSLSQSCHILDIDSKLVVSSSGNELSSSSSSLPNEAAPDSELGRPLLAASMDSEVQRDNQWLGVTVKSQGPNGYAMACAHRYVLKGPNYRFGQGICYSLTKNLNLHRTWQPCLNRPVNMAHEEYAYCQAGTSGDISGHQNHSAAADIVIGAPGPYTWRGTVFTNSISFSPKDDRTWYMAPVQDNEARVDKYSYLGMSVISGNFFNKQQYYVSGAPRSKEIGQVLFMMKQNTNTGHRGDSNFRTDQILDGEQLGSSFGYTLAKLDFNGDQLPDLAVAAPFYYSKTEGGAVYLYANEAGKSVIPAGKLTGPLESRFGFALANCGDLNQDKYEDLAIGAPYDSKGGKVYIYLGSAQGLKSQPSQVIEGSSISTNMQTFGYSLTGGLDMDQNKYPDLVVGSYMDDSVYILRARPIVEIQTTIEGNLTKIDPNKTTCDGEKNHQLPCFKFNTCFVLDSDAIGGYSDSMKLRYRIEAETFAGSGQKFSRVKFQESENSPAPHIVEKEILLENYYKRMKLKRCQVQRVYIKDRSDIQTPIQFKLSYELVQPTNQEASSRSSSSSSTGGDNDLLSTRYSSSSSSSNLLISHSSSYSSSGSLLLPPNVTHSSSSSSSSYQPIASANNDKMLINVDSRDGLAPPFPILNQEEAQRIFSAKFLKDCGSNDICESHLSVDGQLVGPRESLGINEPGYPTDKQINVTIRATNAHEPAYESRLFVSHPASLLYGGFKTLKQAASVECQSVDKGLIKCDLGNPMPKGMSKLLMIFNTQNQAGTFDFNLMVNTTSKNSKDAKASYDLSATIKKKTELPIPARPNPGFPDSSAQDPPGWLIVASILLGLILFSALFYCLYVNGFFERSKAAYTATDTQERFN